MKKTLIFCVILFAFGFPRIAHAQQFILDSNALSQVRVRTVVGKHQAISKITKATLNPSTGDVYCQLSVADFDFGPTRIYQAATTVKRFLEAYMEIGKYPDILFEGRIAGIHSIDFTKEGKYTLSANGNLSAHGIRKKIEVPVTLSVKGKVINVETAFNVKPADDYKIRADTPPKYAYFKEVEISGHIVLIKP